MKAIVSKRAEQVGQSKRKSHIKTYNIYRRKVFQVFLFNFCIYLHLIDVCERGAQTWQTNKSKYGKTSKKEKKNGHRK